jgi:predicted membrane-bound dolichyl-phosphate-mannose-protein mannosyltransferase
VITGTVVSTNVIVCEQLAVFVQSSVAVHVRRKTRTAGQAAGRPESTKVNVTLVSQVSVAVALSNAGVEPVTHSLVRFGWQVRTGGVVSMNVIVWEHVAVFVQSSVAVHVRRKMRTAGQIAGSVVSTNVSATFVSHVSVAVALSNTGAEPVTHWFVRLG